MACSQRNYEWLAASVEWLVHIFTKAASRSAMPKTMKVVSASLRKRHVFAGKSSKTKGGLTKSDLVQNRRGKIVSAAVSDRSKRHPWILACAAAKRLLNLTGFVPIKKGTPFYRLAKRYQRIFANAA